MSSAVDALAATGAPPAPGRSGSSLGAMDGDAFMKLLVEQMRAQDPTDPQSATEFVAQLATFAEVEQSVKIKDALATLTATAALDAAGMIGRHVEGPEGSGIVRSVRLTGEGALATLESGASMVLGPGVTVRAP